MPGVHNFIQPTGNSRLPFSMLGGRRLMTA
jgi:hypothetical protein